MGSPAFLVQLLYNGGIHPSLLLRLKEPLGAASRPLPGRRSAPGRPRSDPDDRRRHARLHRTDGGLPPVRDRLRPHPQPLPANHRRPPFPGTTRRLAFAGKREVPAAGIRPDCPWRIFCERLPRVLPAHARSITRLSEAHRDIGFALGGEADRRRGRPGGEDDPPLPAPGPLSRLEPGATSAGATGRLRRRHRRVDRARRAERGGVAPRFGGPGLPRLLRRGAPLRGPPPGKHRPTPADGPAR